METFCVGCPKHNTEQSCPNIVQCKRVYELGLTVNIVDRVQSEQFSETDSHLIYVDTSAAPKATLHKVIMACQRVIPGKLLFIPTSLIKSVKPGKFLVKNFHNSTPTMEDFHSSFTDSEKTIPKDIKEKLLDMLDVGNPHKGSIRIICLYTEEDDSYVKDTGISKE